MSFLVARVDWAVRRTVIAVSRALIEAASSFRDYEAGDYLQDARYPPGDDPAPRDDDVQERRGRVAEVRACATAEAKHVAREIR
jgi:hypothetical protein